MKFVHGHQEARWAPSRFDRAIFRLGAYARLRLALRHGPARPSGEIVLSIDRHQSAFETYVTAAWLTLTAACFLETVLPAAWPSWLALLASAPLAVLCLEIPLFVSGLILHPLWNRLTGRRGTCAVRFNSVVFFLFFLTAALLLARHSGWERYAAWQFLAICGVNAIAAGAVHLLKDSIVRAEALAGGSSSAG